MIGTKVTWKGKEFEVTDVLPYDEWFNWDPVFTQWEQPYTFLKPGSGYYDMENGGIWVPGNPTVINKNAIILPMTPEDLKYDVGGSYTLQDIKIYIRCEDVGFRVYYARRIGERT